MVSMLRGDGSVSPDMARGNGAALAHARKRMERAYPELCRRLARSRLVVMATKSAVAGPKNHAIPSPVGPRQGEE